MLSVENILGGTDHDIWSVNVEEDYHEEKSDGGSSSTASGGGTGRSVPVTPKRTGG